MTRPAEHDQREQLRQEIARCWPLAQAYWSRFLLLGQPIDDASQPSIARIDLLSRQVSLNAEQIRHSSPIPTATLSSNDISNCRIES
jgi:hypothetical protein